MLISVPFSFEKMTKCKLDWRATVALGHFHDFTERIQACGRDLTPGSPGIESHGSGIPTLIRTVFVQTSNLPLLPTKTQCQLFTSVLLHVNPHQDNFEVYAWAKPRDHPLKFGKVSATPLDFPKNRDVPMGLHCFN